MRTASFLLAGCRDTRNRQEKSFREPTKKRQTLRTHYSRTLEPDKGPENNLARCGRWSPVNGAAKNKAGTAPVEGS